MAAIKSGDCEQVMERQKYNFGPEQICIPLSRGRFCTIDIADLSLVAQYRWLAARNFPGNVWYAYASIARRRIAMHSLITGLSFVDHRDGNGLNNRRSNIRQASRSQNATNCRTWSSSGFKGIQRNKKAWSAKIGIDGKVKRLGTFPSKEQAARAYDAAAREQYGEFACVNFPRPGERSALTGEIVPLDQKVSA